MATDLPTVLLLADRMAAARSCDVPLDPYGAWLVENDFVPVHSPPPYQQSFVDQWQARLQGADYLVLSVEGSDYIPWTPELSAWFDTHYVLVGSGPSTFIYLHLPQG